MSHPNHSILSAHGYGESDEECFHRPETDHREDAKDFLEVSIVVVYGPGAFGDGHLP